MEFQIYCDNVDVALDDSSSSKTSWHIPSEGIMNNNDDYFSWNALKADDDDYDDKLCRKRRSTTAVNNGTTKPKKRNYVAEKNPPIVATSKLDQLKKSIIQSGSTRMPPHWQVDDIADLNEEIDNSLTDLKNTSYNMSDAILSISGLTVFKQEALSPTTSNDVAGFQISHRNAQSPTSTQDIQRNTTIDENSNDQHMINNTINQLLNQTTYTNLQNAIDVSLVSSPSSQDNYNVSSTNFTFSEDCRFQYVLAAATSIATKVNEDTLTYLNQGQSYEIKLKKLGDLSMYRGKMLKSIIRICFHERRLQYMEKEQMTLWQKARPGDRILDVDVPLSYGAYDIIQPAKALNVIHFSWDPTKEVGVYVKVNCISTEFTPKKHGGEKGVPFRIQVETYPIGESIEVSKRLHAAACQIKVFKLKGADRKHKQDREKILKRPVSEQDKFQPSYECTVLNDIPNEAVLSSPPIAPISLVESEPANNVEVQIPTTSNENIAAERILSPQPPVLQQNIQHFQQDNSLANAQLVSNNTLEETGAWLTKNRFIKHLETFSSFSGADMLRLSRSDLIQICGQAEGIRLFNALHSKIIEPKLKLYICREKTKVFSAIFLSSLDSEELLKNVASALGIPQDQAKDIYIQGPQNIHVQLSNEAVRHIKDDAIFYVEIIQQKDFYIFLLKPTHF